jgi:type IV pilus assembly protein PilW
MTRKIDNGLNSKQKGFTLLELMIAMVLGLILVAGVIQIFISNKQAYRVTDAHSKLQDNARFALEVLSSDIRSAGFSGCRAIEDMNVVTIADAPIPASFDENNSISGSNAQTATTWNPALSASLGTVVGGTDVITVQRGQSCGGTLVKNVTSSNAQIHIFSPNTCNVQAGDVLMLTDCSDAHVFRASNASTPGGGKQTIAHAAGNQANHFCKSYSSLPQTGACDSGNAKLYDYDAELLAFSSASYFIRLDTNGDPALWVYSHTAAEVAGINPIELIKGIEDMQIEYGVDTNDDDIVDNYSDANVIAAAGQWDKVLSARISLLAQTQQQRLTTADQSINFNGAPVADTSDGRLRRVFTTTIGVRNRVQ